MDQDGDQIKTLKNMLGLSKTICMTVIMKSLNIISHTQHTATKKELITHVLELKIRIGIYM